MEKDKFMDKYNHPGVYVIYIDGVIAYIGQSIDMADRINRHLSYIKNPKTAKRTEYHKYQILNQAYQEGHTITFDVVFYVHEDDEPMIIHKKLIAREAGFLSQYIPPLNYRINKDIVNPTAYKIKLEDLLKREKKQIKSAAAG